MCKKESLVHTYLISVWFCGLFCGFDLVKIVLVKLTDKARKIVVFEMLWEDDLGKLVRLLDNKRFSTLAP